MLKISWKIWKSEKDEIDKVKISKSMDDWFEKFIHTKEKEKQRKKWLKQIKLYSSRVAVFILVLISMFAVVTMSVEAFRVRILNYFMEKSESYTEFRVDEVVDGQSTPQLDMDQYYYPTYLPAGYTYDSAQSAGNVAYSDIVMVKMYLFSHKEATVRHTIWILKMLK